MRTPHGLSSLVQSLTVGGLVSLLACGGSTSPSGTDAGTSDADAADAAAALDLGARTDMGSDDGGTVIDSGVEPDLGSTDTGIPPEISFQAGTFTMGDEPFGDRERQVTLTRSFLLQEHEVTQAEWSDFFSSNPSATQNPEHPVERLSWYDALAYANALSTAAGLTPCYDLSECAGTPGAVGFGAAYSCNQNLISFDYDCNGYRLPTEAEWEYAAQLVPDPNVVCDGDANIDLSSTRCGVLGYTTEPVLSRPADGSGLYGMQGNVAEWIWDRFDTYRGTEVTDPVGPNGPGDNRMTRGGGWRFNARRCRITHRSSRLPSCQADSIGLRMARTLRP